jgi:hypothetical protein
MTERLGRILIGSVRQGCVAATAVPVTVARIVSPTRPGWEGYCRSCLALWDDHAAGRHDPPEDDCLLCR